MKKIFSIIMVLFIWQLAFAQQKPQLIIHKTGDDVIINLEDIEDITFSESQIPTEGLVAYYPFNEDPNDASIHMNDGTCFGDIQWVSDRNGNAKRACYFNGSNSYISVPNSETIQLRTNKMTIALWFNCEGTPQGPAAFVGKNNTSNEPSQYTFQLNPFNTIHFGINDNSNVLQWIHKSYSFDYNKWYFLAVTWDGKISKIYLDGLVILEQNFDVTMKIDEHPLEIGRDTGGDTDWYKGILDDIRIYNRALSDEEVQFLFNEK